MVLADRMFVDSCKLLARAIVVVELGNLRSGKISLRGKFESIVVGFLQRVGDL